MPNKLIDQLHIYFSRKMLKLPDEIKDMKYSVKIVETATEYFGALRLLYDSYVYKGLMSEDPRRLRLTLHHLLPETNIIIVKCNEEIIATGTVIHDHQIDFPSAKIYKDEFLKFKNYDYQITELSSLAVHPDFRNKNNIIQILISKFYAQFVNRLYSKPYHICSAHPKSILFYQLLFNLKQTGRIIGFDYVNSAEASFIHGPISTADLLKLESNFSNDKDLNFMSFFCSPDSRFKFPAIDSDLSVGVSWVRELIRNIYPILLEESDMLSNEHHKVISQVYTLFGLDDRRLLKFMDRPRSYRLKSRLNDFNNKFSVLNISDSGALLLDKNFSSLSDLQKGVVFNIHDERLSYEFNGELSRIEFTKEGIKLGIKFKKPSFIINKLLTEVSKDIKKVA